MKKMMVAALVSILVTTAMPVQADAFIWMLGRMLLSHEVKSAEKHAHHRRHHHDYDRHDEYQSTFGSPGRRYNQYSDDDYDRYLEKDYHR